MQQNFTCHYRSKYKNVYFCKPAIAGIQKNTVGRSESARECYRFTLCWALVVYNKLRIRRVKPAAMLPAVCNQFDSNEYVINEETVSDLFDAVRCDRDGEMSKLQDVLDQNQSSLHMLYSRNGKGKMNRMGFESLVEMSIGQEAKRTANEIYSCATNLYSGSGDDGEEGYFGEDKAMTKTEFVTGVVRLSNLLAMMDDGMVNTNNLSTQTQKFLTATSGSRK